jgi:hypothetical protein
MWRTKCASTPTRPPTACCRTCPRTRGAAPRAPQLLDVIQVPEPWASPMPAPLRTKQRSLFGSMDEGRRHRQPVHASLDTGMRAQSLLGRFAHCIARC